MTDVSDPHVVEEVNRRLDSIDIDGILEAGQLEQLISDSPLSIFPLVERTERPDKVAASLLEGRVAVVVDNSPHVLLMPVSAWVFIQASDDYYENVYLSSAVRLLRFVAFMAATFSTAAYVAAVGYHQELVPLSLLLRIVATHEGIPFGTLITALLMEVAVEILREAGVRLPRPIGVAVSIVGALIIGDAAVTAGFAPPGMVIIVAFATIASFAIPGYGLAIAFRLLRFPIIIASGLLGLFGLGLSAMFLLAYACSLTSVGYPYFEFLSPNYTSQLTDKLAVFPPQYRSRRRPQWSQGSDKFRQGIPRGYPPVLTSNRNNEHSEGDEAQDEPAKNKEQHD